VTYEVKWSARFKRNFKRAVKLGLDPNAIKEVISLLRDDGNA